MTEPKYTLKGGTVYAFRDGWRARATYRTPTGEYTEDGQPVTRLREKSRVFKVGGKREAKRLAAEWVDELNENAEAGPRPAETVAEYVDAFICSKEGRAEKSTIAGYRRRAKYIHEGLGSVRLIDLTPDMITSWMNRLSKDLSPASVNDARVLLKSAMQDAYLNRRIPFNPVDRTKKLKTPKKEPNALGQAEIARLIQDLASPAPAVSGNESAALKLGIIIALFTGMRQGEICGLRWRNVDTSNGIIRVREAVGRDGDSSYIKEPKTGGSRREIPIPAPLVELLEQRRRAMKAGCLEAGVSFDARMFVIGEIDGSFADPRHLYRAFDRRVKRLNLIGTQGKPPTFHDLRHTFATKAIANGVDVKSVSSILGHANAAMTLNIYASADPDATRRAMDAVAKTMTAPTPTAEVLELKPTGTEA